MLLARRFDNLTKMALCSVVLDMDFDCGEFVDASEYDSKRVVQVEQSNDGSILVTSRYLEDGSYAGWQFTDFSSKKITRSKSGTIGLLYNNSVFLYDSSNSSYLYKETIVDDTIQIIADEFSPGSSTDIKLSDKDDSSSSLLEFRVVKHSNMSSAPTIDSLPLIYLTSPVFTLPSQLFRGESLTFNFSRGVWSNNKTLKVKKLDASAEIGEDWAIVQEDSKIILYTCLEAIIKEELDCSVEATSDFRIDTGFKLINAGKVADNVFFAAYGDSKGASVLILSNGRSAKIDVKGGVQEVVGSMMSSKDGASSHVPVVAVRSASDVSIYKYDSSNQSISTIG